MRLKHTENKIIKGSGMTPETEIELLKKEVIYLKEKVNVLFKIVTEHMKQEEKERQEIDKKLAALLNNQTKRTSFAAGIIATTSVFWVVIIASATLYIKLKI